MASFKYQQTGLLLWQHPVSVIETSSTIKHDNSGTSSGLIELFSGCAAQLPPTRVQELSTTRVPWMISQSCWQRSVPLTLQRMTGQIKREISGRTSNITLELELKSLTGDSHDSTGSDVWEGIINFWFCHLLSNQSTVILPSKFT
jgi:hypothetical protein